jgi:hypothetical protein
VPQVIEGHKEILDLRVLRASKVSREILELRGSRGILDL